MSSRTNAIIFRKQLSIILTLFSLLTNGLNNNQIKSLYHLNHTNIKKYLTQIVVTTTIV